MPAPLCLTHIFSVYLFPLSPHTRVNVMNVFFCAQAIERVRGLLPHYCPSSYFSHVPRLVSFAVVAIIIVVVTADVDVVANVGCCLFYHWEFVATIYVVGTTFPFCAVSSSYAACWLQTTAWILSRCVDVQLFFPVLHSLHDSWRMSLIVLFQYISTSLQIKANKQVNERLTISVKRISQTAHINRRVKLV